MEDLLKPDFGVLALTVCNFLLLVYLLKKFAWGPIIGALEKREKQIAQDKQTAAEALKSPPRPLKKWQQPSGRVKRKKSSS